MFFRGSRYLHRERNTRLPFGSRTVPERAPVSVSAGGHAQPYFFMQHPEVFYDFYRSKMLHPHAQPNGCHRLLSRLEHDGKLKAVITQNIDGLHQSAGCSEVLELHGSVHRNYCMDCSRFYSLQDILDIKETVPRCKDCGGWFGRTSCCMKRNWTRTSSCARSRKYRRPTC